MNKNLKRGLIATGLVVVLYALFSGDSTPDKNQYRTEAVTRGNITNAVTATGTINPEEVVNVGTQVSGQIIGLYAKVNDEVKKGQLLAEIDPQIPLTQLRQSKASLETAKFAYELAKRDLERTRALVAKDFVAKRELESAEQSVISSKNSLESAKIQVERDEVNLSYTKLTSPIDGVVISQEVSSGQTLAANFQTPNLYRIAKSLTQMQIDVNIPESDISNIKLDMPVTFTVDAFQDRTFTGKVTSINLNPNNQQGVVTYSVKVLLENQDRALFPGMTATVSLTISEKTDVLRIPAAALRFSLPEPEVNILKEVFTESKEPSNRRTRAELGNKSVYVLRGGKPELVAIETGATDEIMIEAIPKEGEPNPLQEGDLVITGSIALEP